MAPKTTNYSKSMIYKIEHMNKPELLYVGSTTDFVRRKAQHKQNCNSENGRAYIKTPCKMTSFVLGFSYNEVPNEADSTLFARMCSDHILPN